MYRTGVLNTLSIQQIEQIVKKNLCWQRSDYCFVENCAIMSAKEKQALHNAAFAFSCAINERIACGSRQ